MNDILAQAKILHASINTIMYKMVIADEKELPALEKIFCKLTRQYDILNEEYPEIHELLKANNINDIGLQIAVATYKINDEYISKQEREYNKLRLKVLTNTEEYKKNHSTFIFS